MISSILRGCRPAAAVAVLVLAACDGDSGTNPPPAPDSLVVQVDGRLERGGTVQLSATRNGAPVTPTWTADPAASVVFLEDGAARFIATGTVRISASTADAAGSAVYDVTIPPSVAFERTVDGQRDIWRVALDGGDLTRLTEDPAEDLGASAAAGQVWFVSYRVAPAAVFSVPAAGGTATRVSSVAGEYRSAAVSPDGTRLAFIRTVAGVGRVFVSDVSGANARRLVSTGGAVIEAAPAWSPDGSRLTYVSTAGGNADVHVIPAAGGTAQVLASTPAAEVEPAFSPDGRHGVFVRATSNGTDLYSVEIATGAVRQLTDRPGVESGPAWLEDGRIVFTIIESGSRRLAWLDPATPGQFHTVPGTLDPQGRLAGLH